MLASRFTVILPISSIRRQEMEQAHEGRKDVKLRSDLVFSDEL